MESNKEVIDGLEYAWEYIRERPKPSATPKATAMHGIRKAVKLLKEQEAVEPYQHDAVWLCGNCEKEVVGWDDDIDGKEYRYPFCRQCGRPVKWE